MSRGRGEEKDYAPFPRAGFQDEAGLSQGRRKDFRLNQFQGFNYYLGLGMLRSEMRLFFLQLKEFLYCLNMTVSSLACPSQLWRKRDSAAIKQNLRRLWGGPTKRGSAPTALRGREMIDGQREKELRFVHKPCFMLFQ